MTTINSPLNSQQLQTLRSAVDRIIPADDYPSGWEAGVGDYLERLFAREPRFVPVYQSGLDALEAKAQAAAGVSLSAAHDRSAGYAAASV